MAAILGASEVSANLYCNLRTSVFGRLRDYMVTNGAHVICHVDYIYMLSDYKMIYVFNVIMNYYV